jgi:eukaryotic-like serine/threonine-protein kinase
LALTLGASLGHFTIVRLVGTGGMGEVYEAQDAKLGRSVAIKVLPDPLVHQPERMARFEREARLLASLNHPNIATIYGIEEAEGVRFLILELVPGETMAGLFGRGPMEVAKALGLFRQVAEALEAAHESGVVHRDLKPANVKVTPAGQVKVLDFGLAKAFADPASPTTDGARKTLSIDGDPTREGLVLGTPAYMSPEQARGRAVDRRTDVWAFGCCLYEALTGRKVFEAETHTDQIAAVLGRDVDWQALPPRTPARIRDLLRRCLQRDLQRRLRHIGDARIEIEDALAEPTAGFAASSTPAPRPEPRWRRLLPWGLTAVLGLVTAVAVYQARHRSPPAVPPLVRFVVALPSTARLDLGERTALALSPDGSRLVYVASDHVDGSPVGAPRLHVRAMSQLEGRPMAGTEGASGPFFSPDGQWVGFFADGALKKVSIAGGAPLPICEVAPVARGASWAPDDMIVLAPTQANELHRVPAAGGVPQPLTALDTAAGELAHLWPEVLPGGRAVLFTIKTADAFDEARIAVLPIGAPAPPKTLVVGGTHARYSPSGHIVYGRAGGLLAVPFDLERLEIRGAPLPVLEGVSMDPRSGVAHFALSASGTLAYVPGGASGGARSLLWVDRRGSAQPVTQTRRAYLYPALSPDGERLAVTIEDANQDIWMEDLPRGTLTRLTFDQGEEFGPVWTRDGTRLALASVQAGRDPAVFWMLADGGRPPELLLEGGPARFPSSFSPRDRVLAYTEQKTRDGADIWLLPLDDPAHPRPFLRTPFQESAATFSPDGSWIAYVSNESGRNEVYVLPYPGPGGKRQISTEGGTSPAWAWDGRELFYRSGDAMLSVGVVTLPRFSAEAPRLLFRGPYQEPARPDWPCNYAVSLDGQRFVMIGGDEPAPAEVHVVLSWLEEQRGRASPR